MSSPEVEESAGQREVLTPAQDPPVEEGPGGSEDNEADTAVADKVDCPSSHQRAPHCPPHRASWRPLVSELLVMVPLPTTRPEGYSSPRCSESHGTMKGRSSPESNRTNKDTPTRGTGRTGTRGTSSRPEVEEETKGQRERRIRKQLSLGPVGVSAGSGFLVSGPHWVSAGHTQRWPFSSRLQCHLVSAGGATSRPSRCAHAACWGKAPSTVTLSSAIYRPVTK